jgi:RNA polymerase sporulation-specific sigma factor
MLAKLHQYTGWHAPSYFLRRRYHFSLDTINDDILMILVQSQSRRAKEELIRRYENNFKKASDEVLVLMSQEGERDAMEFLVERYQPFVKKIINRLKNKFFFRGFEANDLVQEGFLGLFKAIDDFKIERKTKFKDFSKHVIEKHIGTLILRSSNYKNKVLNESFSYHSPIGTESEITFEQLLKSETYAPEESCIKKETFEAIEDKLTDLEKSVLKLYSRGLSYEEIGFDVIKNISSITQIGNFNFKEITYKDLITQLEDKEFRLTHEITEEEYKEFLQLVKKKKKAIDNTIQRIRKKGKYYMSNYENIKNNFKKTSKNT